MQIVSTPLTKTSKQFYIALTLCVFAGIFGAHRFYLSSRNGLLQLLTLGGFGIWTFVDLIRLLSNDFADKNGKIIINPNPIITWSVAGLIISLFILSPDKPEGDDKIKYDFNSSVESDNAGLSASELSPENQFKKFQEQRMGPSHNIVAVLMNEKTRNGSRVLYEGFYSYQLNIKGLVGAQEETVFFTAVFVNGKMVEWMPIRH